MTCGIRPQHDQSQLVRTSFRVAASEGDVVPCAQPAGYMYMSLQPGTRVALHSLRARADLNDREATLVEYCDGRWNAVLIGGGEGVRLRPENLTAVSSSPQEETAVAPPIDDIYREIMVRPGCGRGAIARQHLCAGSTVENFSSFPFAALLLKPSGTKRCERCMRTVSDDDDPAATSWLAGISPRGLGAVYCSALCQSVDLTENQHEAALRVSPLPALVDQWEPRLAARCLWTRVRGGQSDVDAALFDEMTAEASEVSDDASISAAACALEGFLPPGATASDFASLLRRLRANAFMISDDAAGQTIGAGCYPRAAVLNHSCAPNCVLTCGLGAELRVRTYCAVPAGTELVHSYVDLTRATAARQRVLHAAYAFDCVCNRCVNGLRVGGEDVDSLIDAASDMAHEGIRVEPASAEEADPIEASRKLLREASERGLLKDDGAAQAAAQFAWTALEIRRAHCHRLSILRFEAEVLMGQLAMCTGDSGLGRATECGRNAVAFLEVALSHVPWHPKLSTARMLLAVCEGRGGDTTAGLRLMEKCVPSLMITHGAEHTLTRRAQGLASAFIEAERSSR